MNFWEDAKQVETLATGAVVVCFQAVNLWRSIINAKRIESVRKLVVANSSEAIAELQAAHASIGRVMVAITGERRRPAPGAEPNIIARRDAAEADLRRRFTDRG